MRRVSCFFVVVSLAVSAAARAQQPGMATFDAAYLAWDTGRYAESLEYLQQLLRSDVGDGFVEPAALLTGELLQSTELTVDGAAPRWSRDGRLVAYETGSGDAARTVVVAVDGPSPRVVAEIRGRGLVLSPDGARAAWLSVPDLPELRSARDDVDRLLAAGDRQGVARRRQDIALIEAERAHIVLRDLGTGRETQIDVPGVTRGALIFADDGELYLLGGAAGQAPPPAPAGRGGRGGRGGGPGGGQVRGDRIYRVTGTGAPASMMPMGPIGEISGLYALDGRRLLLDMGRTTFGVLDLATGAARTFEGTAASPSADGRWVVFTGRDGEETTVNRVATDGRSEPVVVTRTTLPLTNPAIAPDGSRIAFAMMQREDWEIHVVSADGSGEIRVTREIQHDIVPHFLTGDRLLALVGEPRHRRSYLYDLTAAAQPEGTAEAMALSPLPGTPGRTRLHHNNTVRTVAPEYAWVPSHDGSKVLIIADRDGDTISPERGLYLMDLTRKITRDALLERIDANLEVERRLRDNGEHAFAPIRTAVADAVARVSTTHIYTYANDVFQFDSKYITQPGNAKAIAYYAARLREFGYEPELQWFEARGVRTANVVARLTGTVDPDLVYVVSSHFDSVQRGPGADDDSSGATALLETARALAGYPQPVTIEFAFFTGEEGGLLGSREFVRRAVADGKRIAGALNNDMVGFRNDNRLDNTIRYSNAGIRDIQHAAAMLFTNLITYDAKYYRSTDAAAYYEAYGDIVGGIGSYPILGSPHYHQTHDVLETIDQQLVAEVSKTTLATVMLLASSPSRLTGLTVTRTGTGVTVQWGPAVESDVTAYLVAWGPAGGPTRGTERVTEPRARLDAIAAGDVVRVKALNARGLEGWDWATAAVR